MRAIEAWLWRVLRFSASHPRAMVAGWLAGALAGLVAAASLLSVNTDSSDMIAADRPFRVDQRAFEAAFPQLDDQVLVLVRAETPDAADIVAGALAERLAGRTDIVSSVFAPAVDPFFARNGLLYLDVEALEDLLARLSRAAPLIERLSSEPSLDVLFDALAQAASFEDATAADAALMDAVFAGVAASIEARLSAAAGRGDPAPLSWRSLFADDLAPPFERLLTLDPVLDFTRLRPARAVVEAIEAEAEAVRADTGIAASVHITGNPVLRSEELESVSRGIGMAFLVSFITIAILLAWGLRSTRLVVFVLASVSVSILVAAGLAAALFEALNLVSIAFVVLMVGLGVDFAVHLLMHAHDEYTRGASPRAALYRTSRILGAALALTAPSTALAFLAFAPTAFIGMAQLGVVAGLGVVIAFIVAVTLLPALFVQLPPRKTDPVAWRERISQDTKTRIGWSLLTLGIASITIAAFVRFDADPMALRDPHAKSVRAFNLLFDDPDNTPYRLSLLAPDAGSAARAAEALEALEPVDRTVTLADFVPADQGAKLDLIDYAAIGLDLALQGERDRPIDPDPLTRLLVELAPRTSPGATRLIVALATYRDNADRDGALDAALERDLLAYWPHEADRLRQQLRAAPVTEADVPEAIRSRFVWGDGGARVEIVPSGDARDPAQRRAFVDAVLAVAPNASGPARNVQEAADTIRAAMIQAIFVAIASVSILLWLVLRDVRLIATMLAPLLLAAILTVATGVVIGLPFNFANVIVLPLLVGIGIDSGIHLALKARQGEAAAAVYRSPTPRAVFLSGVTTIASFGSLSFSPHLGTASMGALLTIAIGWTLACAIFVLPLLMDAFSRKRDPGDANPAKIASETPPT